MTKDSSTSKPFLHQLVGRVVGKAGEVKTVSATASDGRLLVFRGHDVFAWDDAKPERTGSVIERADIGGEELLGVRITPTFWRSPDVLSRGMWLSELHPRLGVSFTVRFLKDCEFQFCIPGQAREVPNEGVYACVPTVPCGRSILEDFHPFPFGDILVPYHLGGRRCDRCWFRLRDHALWPVKDRAFDVNVPVIALDGAEEIIVEVERPFYVSAAILDRDLERSLRFEEKREYTTDGFALAGGRERTFTASGEHFDYHLDKGLYVPKDSAVILRVGNSGSVKRTFAGKVTGQEVVLA